MSDLISRQDAIDALGEEPLVWYDGEDEIAERNQWRRDKAAIESLPSAEPRKKGKWIDSRDVSWMCSECGKWLDVLQGDVKMNFCPNCGSYNGGDSE